jgi:hypothetical protein
MTTVNNVESVKEITLENNEFGKVGFIVNFDEYSISFLNDDDDEYQYSKWSEADWEEFQGNYNEDDDESWAIRAIINYKFD